MTHDSLILAIDGGGTASRAALYREDGTIHSECTIGPLSCKSSGRGAVGASLTELRGFLGDEATRARCAVLGLSGLDCREDYETMHELMVQAGLCGADSALRRHPLGFKCNSSWGFPVLLCSDALLPLFANGLTEGTVVIAGTGSVAMRIGSRGVERFGGWGYRTSDEGSGCWVGCEFMRQALHVADEILATGGSAARVSAADKTLLDEAFQATREQSKSRVPLASSPERKARFLREWATLHDDPKEYASLARRAMTSRSAECRKIKERAAERVAWLASLACTQEAPAVVLSGGLFQNPGFCELAARKIAECVDVHGLNVVANQAKPTSGAFALAMHVWPLHPAVPAASNANVRKSMQGNKGADTKPEMVVREALRAAGLSGYRLHWKAPGRPDVAWPSKKVCIMINGCFWHRHEGCSKATMPKSNTEYWIAKFDRNVERDAENLQKLEADGWRVHTVWECELDPSRRDETFANLIPALRKELGK